MFLPKGSYHFSNGCFQKIRKWPKRVKVGILTAFTIFSLTIVTNVHYTEAQRQHLKETAVGVHHKLVDFVTNSNPKLTQAEARNIVSSTYKMSEKFGIDEKLILAVAKVESNFQKHAISPTGAYGIMQVIPSWHKEKILKARHTLGNPEIFDVKTNIYLGTWVLSDCLDRSNKKLSNALMCYSGKTPGYDKKVMDEYRNLKRI